MKQFSGVILAFALGLCAMPAIAQTRAPDPVTTASTLLDRLDAGDYIAATTDFNTQMADALGADQLEGVQQQIETAGAVTSRDDARVSTQSGHTVVVIRIHREQATLDATIAIDADGKVAGLYFAPVSTP